MLDADIQNSSRLVKLYKHLPEKDLDDIKLLMSFENLSEMVLPTDENLDHFKNQLEKVHELSDEDIFDILSSKGSSNIKNVLNGIIEQMHVYIALREHVVDENIQWLV